MAVMFGVALLVIGALAFAWWRRTRRDRGEQPPWGELPEDATIVGEFPALYVATTRHDEPLERLAIRGLAYRSRAQVTVADAGVRVALTGQPDVLLPPDRIVSVAQATVAIDRVVERDGLTLLSWRTDGGTTVDSYFRPQEVSARALADAIGSILATSPGVDA